MNPSDKGGTTAKQIGIDCRKSHKEDPSEYCVQKEVESAPVFPWRPAAAYPQSQCAFAFANSGQEKVAFLEYRPSWLLPVGVGGEGLWGSELTLWPA